MIRFKRASDLVPSVSSLEVFSLKKCKVLVTGSAAPGFVSIIKALKTSSTYKLDIIGTDYIETLSSKTFVKKHYVLADNRSPKFVDSLLDVCKRENVDVILPIRTDDQLPICKRFGEFRDAGIEPAIVTTNPELLDTLLNKKKLLEYCQNVIHLRTPDYHATDNADEFRDAASKLGYPDFPIAVKPCYSNGSRGFRILDQKIDKRKQFFEEKPTGIYSSLDELLSIIGDTFPEMLLMEYLPGNEYTVDVLCRKGITFAAVPRLRTKMTGGITTGGVVANDDNYPIILESCKSVIEGFGLSYNVGLQFKVSRDGVPLLLEVNPRLQGTTTMSVAAGVNIPELMIKMALEEFDYKYTPSIKWGLEMHRIWQELFNDGKRIWKNE